MEEKGSPVHYPDTLVPSGSAATSKTFVVGNIFALERDGKAGRGATAAFNRDLITSPFNVAFKKETRIPTGCSCSTNNNRGGEKEKYPTTTNSLCYYRVIILILFISDFFDTLQCLTSQAHLVPFKSKAVLQFARRKCDKH